MANDQVIEVQVDIKVVEVILQQEQQKQVLLKEVGVIRIEKEV
jgi:hypothetical protein